MNLARRIGGVLAGLIVAGAIVAGVEAVAHTTVSGPALFGAVAAGYGLAALGGTTLAARVADARTAMAVPLLLGTLGILNLFAIAHPWWFVPTAIVALAAGWRLGLTVGASRTTAI